MSDEEKTALLLIEQFGYCEDEDFTINCYGCLASHLVRVLRDEQSPKADAMLGRAFDMFEVPGDIVN